MTYDPTRHHRHSIRLKGYDYTQAGAYFVTMVTYQREHLFGEIRQGEMLLKPIGKMIDICWAGLGRYFPLIQDVWIVMPDHFHAIVLLDPDRSGKPLLSGNQICFNHHSINKVPLPPTGTSPCSLGAIIQNFKSISTRKINQLRATPGASVWQRNYYEHIVRNEAELERIRKYILENPIR